MPNVIEPSDLAQRLANQEPGICVVQVVDEASFLTAHIPGAIHVQPRELVCGVPPAPGRLPEREQLDALFSRIGHEPDRVYVLADDEGGGWAGRFAWTLDVIGHPNWHYLNGGIHGWLAAGQAAETGSSTPPIPQTVSVTVDTGPIAEADEIINRLDDPNLLIWDVRSREEYLGQRAAAPRVGHIPGAVHLDWMALKNHNDATRLPNDLAELLQSHGLPSGPKDVDVITHCQTHHRSGLSYMIGRLLGFTHIRAYHGSWSEWGNRDDTPVSVDPNDARVPHSSP